MRRRATDFRRPVRRRVPDAFWWALCCSVVLLFIYILSKGNQMSPETGFVQVCRNRDKMQKMKNLGSVGSSGRLSTEEHEDEEVSKLAISSFQAKEEEIERKKMEVRERVELQLGRAEEETRRLAHIWEELEVMEDPLRKEVAMVRKKIDLAIKDLKPLGQNYQKKEKEYKEALEAFNEKNKEKAHLVASLIELLTESERLRMKKLEELHNTVESLSLKQ